MLLKFKCKRKIDKNKFENWEGIIPIVINYGTHFEIIIKSKSSIKALFGKTSRGAFICLPDHGIGCNIANLNDKYWNIESLLKVLDEVEALTVAEALFALRKNIQLY